MALRTATIAVLAASSLLVPTVSYAQQPLTQTVHSAPASQTASASQPATVSQTASSSSATMSCTAAGSEHSIDMDVAPAQESAVRASVSSALRDKSVKLHKRLTSEAIRSAEVGALEDGGYILRASTGPDRSNITFQLDSSMRVTHYAESTFRTINDSSGHAKIYRDGALVLNRVVHSSELSGPQDEMTRMGFTSFFSALNSCLASAGIASWLVAAAMLACGGTGPVGAVVCLVGAGIGVGTASYCVRWAIAHS